MELRDTKADALATSIGYAGRRPLPWLACNVARALVLIFVLAHDQAKDGRVCAQFKRNQRENKYC